MISDSQDIRVLTLAQLQCNYLIHFNCESFEMALTLYLSVHHAYQFRLLALMTSFLQTTHLVA